MQADIDFRERGAKRRYFFRQYIAGLGVGCGNGQGATVFHAVLLANALEVADFAQNQINTFENMLAGLGHALKSLSVPSKNLNP